MPTKSVDAPPSVIGTKVRSLTLAQALHGATRTSSPASVAPPAARPARRPARRACRTPIAGARTSAASRTSARTRHATPERGPGDGEAGRPAAVPGPGDRGERGGDRERSERLARQVLGRRDHRRQEGDRRGGGEARPGAGDQRRQRERRPDGEGADDGLRAARGVGVDPPGRRRMAGERVREREQRRRAGRPVQRMGRGRPAVAPGRAQVGGQPHVGALVGRRVAGAVARGLEPQAARGGDQRGDERRDDEGPTLRRRGPGERGQRDAGGRHRRSISVAATVDRELPRVGRTTRSDRTSPVWRSARPQRRAMSRIVRVQGESGWLKRGWTRSSRAAGCRSRTRGLEDRGEAGGAQARHRVAPVHDAGVGDRSERGERSASRPAARARARAPARAASRRRARRGRAPAQGRARPARRCSCARASRPSAARARPQNATATTAIGPSADRRPRPPRREQRPSARARRPGSAAPMRATRSASRRTREASVAPATTATASVPRRACGRPRTTATASPGRGEREQDELGASGRSRSAPIARTTDRPVGRCDHGAPVCGGLVEQRRQPRREQHRGPAEGEHAVAHEARAGPGRRRPAQATPSTGRADEEQRPTRGCRGSGRASTANVARWTRSSPHEGADERAAQRQAEEEERASTSGSRRRTGRRTGRTP